MPSPRYDDRAHDYGPADSNPMASTWITITPFEISPSSSTSSSSQTPAIVPTPAAITSTHPTGADDQPPSQGQAHAARAAQQAEGSAGDGDHPDGNGGNGTSTEKRSKSCAPCRLRRVRCERPPGESDCIACTTRNLPCTPMPTKPRAKVISREGKRIQQARAIFGEVGANSASSTASTLQASPSLSPYSASVSSASTPPTTESESESSRLTALIATLTERTAQGSPNISHSDSESRLALTEVQGALTASLLDAYCKEAPTIALLEEVNLKTAFDIAGRRIRIIAYQSHLDDAYQVYCKVVLALGARTSDHPLLIGTSAPLISELAALAKHGKDLREYGARRENACRVLLQDALDMADRKGTLRNATPEAVTTLLLIESLVEYSGDIWLFDRPYSNAYNGHTKALMEAENAVREAGGDPKPNNVVGDVARWTAFTRDAMASAYTGQAPRFSEDDLFIMLADNQFDTPLVEVIRRGELPNKIESFWHLFGCYMFHLCALARKTPEKLTGPRARRKPLDLVFAAEFIHQVEIAEMALPHLLRRAEMLEEAFDQIGIGKKNELMAIHTLVRNFRVSMWYMYLLLAKIVRQRVGARPSPGHRATIREVGPWPVGSSPRDDEDANYWSQMILLRNQLEEKSFYSVRAIIGVVEETIQLDLPLGMFEWLDVRGIQILFLRLPLWTKFLIDVPTIEQEGPFPDWTFAVKLDTLGTVLNALHSVGWQSERLARPADWISDEIRGLKMQQYEYWQRRACPPAHIPTHSGIVPPLDTVGSYDFGVGPNLAFLSNTSTATPAPVLPNIAPGWDLPGHLPTTTPNNSSQLDDLGPAPQPRVWTDVEIQKFLDDASTMGLGSMQGSNPLNPDFSSVFTQWR
ncbi:BZ3500_MvSof-1268-A1-R1_Chr7-1g09162 [Microbotryum saponariae]|uniref:BZ3500_MvSof-1268-A1-R1_Chr7-1g09162 protein n=1 Tax=Microbotryum saponariae TaxID=289078 RepID=A0A2X0N6Q3_9BASI|nr:BZ3501_MvSof-1269-A2-R1_Chr7-1g08867 [Microbotryum saponariae]SDA02912.1 BZ3500_MvSof-1268-A1-R1_Chr7-1g09162 [Microbotryum saponariae]